MTNAFQNLPAIRPDKITSEWIVPGRWIDRISAPSRTSEGTEIFGCAASRDAMFR